MIEVGGVGSVNMEWGGIPVEIAQTRLDFPVAQLFCAYNLVIEERPDCTNNHMKITKYACRANIFTNQ